MCIPVLKDLPVVDAASFGSFPNTLPELKVECSISAEELERCAAITALKICSALNSWEPIPGYLFWPKLLEVTPKECISRLAWAVQNLETKGFLKVVELQEEKLIVSPPKVTAWSANCASACVHRSLHVRKEIHIVLSDAILRYAQ